MVYSLGLCPLLMKLTKCQYFASRVYQMAKLYLYHPSSGLYGCPLAMTDGAAKSIEALGLPEHLHIAFSRLTTRDPDRFWTSGQWMTERGGGSDVGMFPYLSVRYRMKCSFDVGS